MATKAQTSLEELYRTNNNQLEKNRQKELEEAYVSQELMNKYLNQNLENQGLTGSGIAELYRQQANTDYMNSRANVNSDFASKQQDLYNQYFAAKKEEEDIANAKLEQEKKDAQAKEEAELKAKQDSIFNMYINDVNTSINGYKYIDDDRWQELYDSFDWNAIGEDNAALLQEYLERKKGTTSQRQDKWYKEDSNKWIADKITEIDGQYGDYRLDSSQMDSLMEYAKEVKQNMSDSQWNDFIGTLEQYRQTDEDYIAKTYSGVDVASYIDAKDAGVTSFGTKYNDAGTGKGSQDAWVSKIINMVQKNQLQNGDLVDFDYGETQDKGNSVYMYYNGKFYKTNKTRDDANIYVDKKGKEHNPRLVERSINSAGGGGSFGGRR